MDKIVHENRDIICWKQVTANTWIMENIQNSFESNLNEIKIRQAKWFQRRLNVYRRRRQHIKWWEKLTPCFASGELRRRILWLKCLYATWSILWNFHDWKFKSGTKIWLLAWCNSSSKFILNCGLLGVLYALNFASKARACCQTAAILSFL